MHTKSFYKAVTPEETIDNIRRIFHNCGIFITENTDSFNGFYHSHLKVSNGSLGQFRFSTNGKGKTAAYSLASAYAEMMERLENQIIFSTEHYATDEFIQSLVNSDQYKRQIQKIGILKFRLFPDEERCSIKEIFIDEKPGVSEWIRFLPKDNLQYLKDHFQDINFPHTKLSVVPYYHVNGDNFEKMDPVLMTGSNGMCAGNTPAEAIIQGLSEIFERYVIKKVIFDGINPPQIPLELFRGTEIHERITKMENMHVTILDCSLSIGMPVIGVIIIDMITNKYRVKFGSATTPYVALERCFTEHYQAGDPNTTMHDLFTPSHYSQRTPEEVAGAMYYDNVHSTGEVDIKRILYSSPSYKFENLFSIDGNSFEEELKSLLHYVIDKNGFDLYVRDNSWLGFPSYHIYIPQLSSISFLLNPDDLYFKLSSYNIGHMCKNIKKLDPVRLRFLAEHIYGHNGKTRVDSDYIHLHFFPNSILNKDEDSPELLLSTVFLQLSDYSNAHLQLVDYLKKHTEEEIGRENYIYLNCFRDALHLKIMDNRDCSDIASRLSRVYNVEVVDTVLMDLDSEDKLQYYDLPTCFNCAECPISAGCCHFEIIELINNIRKEYKMIDQNTNAEYLKRIYYKYT